MGLNSNLNHDLQPAGYVIEEDLAKKINGFLMKVKQDRDLPMAIREEAEELWGDL